MKILLTSILTFCLAAQPALACEWSEGITENSDGTYQYTRECHIEVGKTLEKLDKREEQVKKLNKVIELKDLAIKYERDRVAEWKQLSIDLEDRVNTLDKMRERDKWIWFGIGVLVTGAAVYGAGQLR